MRDGDGVVSVSPLTVYWDTTSRQTIIPVRLRGLHGLFHVTMIGILNWEKPRYRRNLLSPLKEQLQMETKSPLNQQLISSTRVIQKRSMHVVHMCRSYYNLTW
jgi:hypothetical protein